MTTLLDSDAEDSTQRQQQQEEIKFAINKKYAKEYEQRKQRQELINSKRNGIDSGGEDDASDTDESSEDEDGDLLTSKLDTDIMKTLNALRTKDKEIYNPKTKFFETEGDNGTIAKRTKDKPMRYKDVMRKQILEKMKKGGEDDDDDSDHDLDGEKEVVEGPKNLALAYNDEQRKIRQAFLQSVADEGSDEDEEDTFVVKKNAKENDGMDQEFLAEVEKLEQNLKRGKRVSGIVDPKGEVEDGETFLLNFFKKRSWIESAEEDRDDETSSEQDPDEKLPMKTSERLRPDGNESSDESLQQLDKNDEFEARYNFRFEAAAAEATGSGADHSIVGYARGQVMNTLRRKDDSRTQKRQERRERKEAERRAKEEQLKRLKNAKRQDMENKLREIKNVLGEMEAGQEAVDEAAILKMLEGDYDPEKFETLMEETFGEEYYRKEDAKWKSDMDLRNDDLEVEGAFLEGDDGGVDLYENDGTGYAEATNAENDDEGQWNDDFENGEDPGYAAEADVQESELERKLRGKVEDELYKLDYEDIVAGIPTRFKYRQVEPNNYGLSAKEILLARDSTLRQYVSLKKMAPYREGGEHVLDRKRRRLLRDTIQRELEEERTEGKKPPAQSSSTTTTTEDPPLNDEHPEGIDTNGDVTSTMKRKRRKTKKRSKTSGEDDKTQAEDQSDALAHKSETNSKRKVEKLESHELARSEGDSEIAPKRRRRRKAAMKEMGKAEKHDGHNATDDIGSMKIPDANIGDVTPQATTATEEGHEKQTSADDRDGRTKSKHTKTDKRQSGDQYNHGRKSKRKTKKLKIEGMTQARLSSYGL